MSTDNNIVETLKARFPNTSDSRIALLARAIELGVEDDLLVRLEDANRVYVQGEQVILPAGKFAHTSKAKGWARLGHGDSARWGERIRGGYSVSECGAWIVYSSDGFKREERLEWKVARVAVGTETWTTVD